MREIGSEFWNVPIKDYVNNECFDEMQWFLSGRSALQSIVGELKECRTVGMPSWCCDCMIKPFIDAGIRVVFYPVIWEDGRLSVKINYDCDILFIMDYFGYSQQSIDVSDFNGIIIRDESHSIFSRKYRDADYYFGSLRKWCGVWTGGYAKTRDEHILEAKATDNTRYVALRERAMALKREYMENNSSSKDYLEVYYEAEKLLDNIGMLCADERDIKVAKKLDVAMIIKKHRENAEILREAFYDWLVFPEMQTTDCPMFVPVIIPDGKRDDLRLYLNKNNVYCPVHWSISNYHSLSIAERFIYDNELSLVCDQRYGKNDMMRIVDCIKHFFLEL